MIRIQFTIVPVNRKFASISSIGRRHYICQIAERRIIDVKIRSGNTSHLQTVTRLFVNSFSISLTNRASNRQVLLETETSTLGRKRFIDI